MNPDTIIALSSGRLPAGVAVIRASGRAVRQLAETLLGSLPEPRFARLSAMRDATGSLIDRGIALFFPAPASFTGEDVLELHVHGGRAVVDRLLWAACLVRGVRLAEAGEFTQRAFLNGKLSLLDAEATADLVNADTEAQRVFAVTSGSGEHRKLYDEWRRRLIHARAFLEAAIDFSDESDVPEDISGSVWVDVTQLIEDMRLHVLGFCKAEILREGLDVVLIGEPNSGKSTLLNALIEREAAIVSERPGTTRDLIEVAPDLDGFKVKITDTAGIRASTDPVERLGIERALSRAKAADLVVRLVPVSEPGLKAIEGNFRKSLVVGTKADAAVGSFEHPHDIKVSAMSGEGLGALKAMLHQEAMVASPKIGEILPWRRRHVMLIETAIHALKQALENKDGPAEINSEQLRLASNDLGRITGAVDVEDMLDVIFSQFCIGK